MLAAAHEADPRAPDDATPVTPPPSSPRSGAAEAALGSASRGRGAGLVLVV